MASPKDTSAAASGAMAWLFMERITPVQTLDGIAGKETDRLRRLSVGPERMGGTGCAGGQRQH
jgi:hypothetical protein